MIAAYANPKEVVGKHGSITVSLDPHNFVVHVDRVGHLSYEELLGYFPIILGLLDELRRAEIPVRVLVDMCRTEIGSLEDIERLTRAATWYRPEDKVAFLVGSSLAKTQHRSLVSMILPAVRVEFFVSVEAAETWLGVRPQAKRA